jgi:hypothetical protein
MIDIAILDDHRRECSGDSESEMVAVFCHISVDELVASGGIG